MIHVADEFKGRKGRVTKRNGSTITILWFNGDTQKLKLPRSTKWYIYSVDGQPISIDEISQHIGSMSDAFWDVYRLFREKAGKTITYDEIALCADGAPWDPVKNPTRIYDIVKGIKKAMRPGESLKRDRSKGFVWSQNNG